MFQKNLAKERHKQGCDSGHVSAADRSSAPKACSHILILPQGCQLAYSYILQSLDHVAGWEGGDVTSTYFLFPPCMGKAAPVTRGQSRKDAFQSQPGRLTHVN